MTQHAAPRFRQPVPLLWWTRRRSYLLFALRELSSLAVAWFVVHLLLLVAAVRGGAGAYRDFLVWSAVPWVLALDLVALAFLLLHAVTWFTLAPRAIVVPGVPARAVAAAHFGGWAAVSAVVVWVLVVVL